MSYAEDLARLNGAGPADFVQALDGIFEHSAWVAERTAARRPLASLRALHDAMTACVRQAAKEEQLALICAHPELAGHEAVEGTLTAASASEQVRLGLDRLGREELDWLAELNRRYRERFGFPCIIALKLHASRAGVLQEFERRAGGTPEAEIDNALEEISHIARARLAQRFGVADARLSTHVLDTHSGVPGTGIAFTLSRADGSSWHEVGRGRTNAQGRTDQPLLTDIDMVPGRWRLQFEIGDYFRRRGVSLPDPPFLDIVPIEFGIADPGGHYHVPLLCSPWSYTTYRGS